MACSGPCFGRPRGRARRARAGPISSYGWATPPSPAPTPTATSEKFARGGVGQAGVETKPFQAWIDDWQMRGLDGMRDDTIAPLELTARGCGFFLRAAARCRSSAGAAGRCRLQPEIGARAGFLLLQPAVLQGGRPHRHRRQAGRGHRPRLDGPGMEQPAAGVGPDRLGLAVAAFQFGREADAVPDAPDRRQRLRVRQLDLAGRQAAGRSPPPTSR